MFSKDAIVLAFSAGLTNPDEVGWRMLRPMPRKPQSITLVVEVDDSPEARAQYLEFLKLIVRRVHADRVEDPQQLVEGAGLSASPIV